MTQESTEKTVVRISEPAGLVAALPAVLGFTPRESLVAIGLQRRDGRCRVGAMARTDLPDTADDRRALLDGVPARLARSGVDAVHLVVVADPGTEADLPQRQVVRALAEAFTALGVTATEAVWTAEISPGAPWRCYDGCCSGTLPDPCASEAAAGQAVAGKVSYRSREEAIAGLAPEAAAESAQRREQLSDAHRAAESARAADHPQAVRDELDALRHAATALGGGETLPAAVVARLVAALSDKVVRDIALGFALGCDDGVRPEHAVQLWWALTRAAPAPEVAEPATLAAFAAVEHGGGAPLSAALERARTGDPSHPLSRLLVAALEGGIDPAGLRELATGAVAEASARIESWEIPQQ